MFSLVVMEETEKSICAIRMHMYDSTASACAALPLAPWELEIT